MGRVKIRADKLNTTKTGNQPTIYEWEDVLAVRYDVALRCLTLLHESRDYTITIDVPKGYEIITDGIPTEYLEWK